MNSSNNKKPSVLVGENNQQKNEEESKHSLKSKTEKLKKPVIFGLMTVVFAGCMYLIFKPSAGKKIKQDTGIGLNEAVPQATDAGLQSDKQKAYEQAQLEQKQQEKRNALASLSDYWNEDTAKTKDEYFPAEIEDENLSPGKRGNNKGNTVLNSYRNTQDALNGFYQEDHSETRELQKQIEELKQQLSDKETTPAAGNIDNQLALMEKSYQMAAKYLPANMGAAEQSKTPDTTLTPAAPKESFVAFTPALKNVVSALFREPTDSAVTSMVAQNSNRGFYSAAGSYSERTPYKNSIRACVQETVLVTGESNVRLRLLESARTAKHTLPEGTILIAQARFQNGRLELKISSIETGGNIIPVAITAYDLDGQPGLLLPYSPERNALTEIAANMSQTSGTSLMMTQSASQQVAGDLSRGLVQGVSGYLSKKIRTPKVTVKAGLQVLLVSK